MEDTYILNVAKSPNDERDFIFQKETNFPLTLDLRSDLFPVRDQGTQGSCYAVSSACMKEYQEKKDYGLNELLSPQFFYDNRYNLYDEDATNNEGMFGRDVMRILKTIGICTEKEYPYGRSLNRNDIPEELYLSAKKHVIKKYARIFTIYSLKKSLYENGPCLITFPVPSISPALISALATVATKISNK